MKQSSGKSSPLKVGKENGKGDGGSSNIPEPKMLSPSVRTRRPKRGGCSGSGGGRPECGENHDNCPRPGRNSYCGKLLLHAGNHKCRSCGEEF